ncbi:MAG: aminoacyl-tRNA hydrolase [Gammaproteobacteria bacterium]|nr:aminoacyl-tRNA hydrolase [Gammaproteobacteria bacterium]
MATNRGRTTGDTLPWNIPDSALQWEFIQSSGPGGQNVNKVATAVRLTIDIANAGFLPEDVRARLLHLAGSRATATGIINIVARTHRTQLANRREALARLEALLRAAAVRSKPRTATKPSKASVRKRLEEKKRTGTRKALRGKVAHERD